MPSLQTSTRLAAMAILLLIAAIVGPELAARDGIRVGMIPDAGSTPVSVEETAPLRDYLAKAVGQPVELIIPTNYNATVEALGNDTLGGSSTSASANASRSSVLTNSKLTSGSIVRSTTSEPR